MLGMIRRGLLKPGDQLPTERELIESLGVGRSTIREGILLKLKKFKDAEAAVVGITESKRKNELGSLNVMSKDGVRFGVGTGFTAEMRKDLWARRDTLVGLMVKFKYFEIGTKDAPRFPVFVGFRHEDD